MSVEDLRKALEEKVKILSLGAGVDSTALLVLRSQGKVDFDVAVFADTGGENPETYLYIEEVIKPFCEKQHIPFAITRREGKTLYDDCFDRKIIPTRMFRSCTDKFKKRALRKFVLQNFPNRDVTFLIGIDAGETKRAKDDCGGFAYPLIELGLDREGCKQVIREAGLPVPVKSGCYFCPFSPTKALLNLLKEHPELYKKAEALEKNGQRYPEMILSNVSLERLRKSKEDQRSMCNFLNKCSMCEVEDNTEAT